jgi:hypothetical protein
VIGRLPLRSRSAAATVPSLRILLFPGVVLLIVGLGCGPDALLPGFPDEPSQDLTTVTPMAHGDCADCRAMRTMLVP